MKRTKRRFKKRINIKSYLKKQVSNLHSRKFRLKILNQETKPWNRILLHNRKQYLNY